MLHDRVEDLNTSQGAAIRYLLSAVSKNTLQTTLSSLEQFSNRGIEFHRFIIMCTVGSALSNRTDERLTLATKLVTAALDRPNALSLVAVALDESPNVVTKKSLISIMSTDLKLSPTQQLQFSAALSIGSATSKAAAVEFLEDFNVPPTAFKEEDTTTRSIAALIRQLGTLPSLDSQLSPISSVTLFPRTPHHATHVSVADVLRELGTGCVTTLADSRELISIFPHKFTDRDVADVLGFFASQGNAPNDSTSYTSLMTASGKTAPKSVSGNNTVVNAMPLLDAMHEGNTHFDWDNIIRLLDQPGADSFRLKSISVIFDAYHRFKQGGDYPSVTLFLGLWRNSDRQRNALEYILRHLDKVNRKGLTLDAPVELLPSIKPAGMASLEMDLWRTFAFVEAAVHVAARNKDFHNDVFRPAVEKLPLLFLYTLFFGTYSGTIENFVTIKYILNNCCPPLDQVATYIIPEAEKRNRLDSLISMFSELTVSSQSRIVDVLGMIFKCKSVIKRFLKGSGSPRLVVAIAMCMDEAGEPSDKWLQKALEGKLHFRASCTENRFSVAMGIVEVAEMLQEKQMYVASATAALNALLASPLKDMLKSVLECARGLLASTDSLFPEDVEAEATDFFKTMHSTGSTANAIAYIESLLKSENARDRQLYACIVSIMFDESLVIGCYPRKELQLFAELYGQMIAKELLPPNQQQRAWGLLLPAIVKPSSYAVEEYGLIALEYIKPRLADWPQYGRALRHIKDLDFRVPGIMAAINRGFKQEESAKNPDTSSGTDQRSTGTNSVQLNNLPIVDSAIVSVTKSDGTSMKQQSVVSKLHTLDIATLITNKNVTSPPRVIQEQMNFLIGNTDMHKLESNAKELSQLLRPEYYEYFADYLVVKRAALEPNYHSIYIELVAKLNSKVLDRALRVATVAAVKRLLVSDTFRTESSDRVLLRNLGSWLGSITLEKSIPILQQDLSFRDLLLQGLREGKLVAVVSFMTRVLNSCARSRFFCPPNPWTMAQLCLLLEVYQLKHLKMTLRFEVEVLCNKLDVTLLDVDQYMRMHQSLSTTTVHMEDALKDIDINKSPDFRVGDDSGLPDQPQQLSPNTQPPTAQQQALRTSVRPLQASAEPFQPKDANASHNVQEIVDQLDIPRRPPILILPETVHVRDEELQIVGSRIGEYRQLLASMLRSVVEEAYNNYAARSEAVAVLSTFNIVTKDFTRDVTVEDMLLAGEAMARSLAASLCFATVRDALPALLTKGATALEARFMDRPVQQPGMLSNAIWASNEELCIRALEYMASEGAAKSLHAKMADVVREKLMAAANNTALRIPTDQAEAEELLRVMGDTLVPPGRMLPYQKDIYCEFFNCMPAVFLFNASLRSVEEAISKYYSTDKYVPLDLNTSHLMEGNTNEGHGVIRQRVLGLLSLITPESAIYYISPVFNKVMMLAGTIDRLNKELNNINKNNQTHPHDASVAADVSANNRSMQIATLVHQMYILILQNCVDRGGEPVRVEFTRLYLKSPQRYNYHKLTADLMRIKILNIAHLDEDLAKTLTTGAPNYVNFAGEIISTVIIKDKVVSSKDMRRTLTALDTIAHSRNTIRASPLAPSPAYVVTQPLSKLVDPSVVKLLVPITLFDDKLELVDGLLEEWIQIWSRSKSHRHSSDERNPSVEFVKTLQSNGLLDNSSLSILLGLSIRLCVEHYATVSLSLDRENPDMVEREPIGNKPGAPPPYRVPYSAKPFLKCDGFTDMVLVLLRCCSLRYESSREQRAEITLLRRVLEVFLRIITTHHDNVASQQFPQKKLPPNCAFIPYFQQQPYVRLISNLMIAIQRQESSSRREMPDDISQAFQTILHRLRPCQYPAFAFGWLELVAHRTFIPRCLRQTEMWGRYAELLIDALNFIEFLTQGNAISSNGLVFYKSVFKLMLILLHDFPLFLIEYHYPLCDAIPPYCVQMLNTVLCSFPPEIRLPEPFQQVTNDTSDMLKLLGTKVQTECINFTFIEFSKEFDPTVLTEYMSKDDEPMPENDMKTVLNCLSNTTRWSLMNAVVLHVAITYLDAHNNTIPITFNNSNPIRLYRYLCKNFSTKHRYHFFCACANHLRYPNIQTNFFSKVMFALFMPSPNVDNHTQICIQEQITRVVAEKTVIVQPHPWGVLSTFVELMRNQKFKFWEKSFIHTPFLEQIFVKLRRTLEVRSAGVPTSINITTPTGGNTNPVALSQSQQMLWKK
ncbi:unnamed protein product [Phytomonas sp. EM1]|nr:unnamed protein product [Phytomonas sp. EM1]|eukprot:CCW62996.1 unnamed protein product [Phytomonas sp. isolate EM1]